MTRTEKIMELVKEFPDATFDLKRTKPHNLYKTFIIVNGKEFELGNLHILTPKEFKERYVELRTWLIETYL